MSDHRGNQYRGGRHGAERDTIHRDRRAPPAAVGRDTTHIWGAGEWT